MSPEEYEAVSATAGQWIEAQNRFAIAREVKAEARAKIAQADAKIAQGRAQEAEAQRLIDESDAQAFQILDKMVAALPRLREAKAGKPEVQRKIDALSAEILDYRNHIAEKNVQQRREMEQHLRAQVSALVAQ